MAADLFLWANPPVIRKRCVWPYNKGATGLGVKSGGGWKGICDKQGRELEKNPGCEGETPAFCIKATPPKKTRKLTS